MEVIGLSRCCALTHDFTLPNRAWISPSETLFNRSRSYTPDQLALPANHKPTGLPDPLASNQKPIDSMTLV